MAGRGRQDESGDTPEAGFTNGIIPAGENGMSLAVIKEGKMLRKNVLVTISQE